MVPAIYWDSSNMIKFRNAFCLAVISLSGCADHEYQQYQGQQQNWPTAPGAFVQMKSGIPVYYGYPPRPYIVLGIIEETSRGRFANAVEGAAHAIRKEQGGDAIIVLNHADQADGSVSFGNAFGNFNANTGFGSATSVGVSIPRRTDKAKVVVIKWK
jgi:hypothetical protein